MNNTQSALLDAINTLSKMPKIDIKGKQYASVASRVEAFRTHFPTAGIETILIQDDVQRVVIQAKVSIDNNIIATGYAEEFRGEGWINSTSALENAETSAIGRALSAFGLSGSEYASSNEVTNAISQQQQKHNNKTVNNTMQSNQQNSNYSSNNQQMQIQSNQTPYKNQHDFQQLTNIGLQIVEKGDMLTVQGDKSTIISNKELLKKMGFRFDFNGTKEWYILLRQAA